MWRNLTAAVKGLLFKRRIPTALHPTTTATGSFAISNEDRRKMEAHNSLKDAVRELSKGDAQPIYYYSSPERLRQWESQPLDKVPSTAIT